MPPLASKTIQPPCGRRNAFPLWWRSYQRGASAASQSPECQSSPMTQKSQSHNVLASPLGEEGHEVAKGWTVVRMIMILDVDVTAERRHYNTHRPRGRYQNPRPERPSNLRTLRTFGAKPRQPSPLKGKRLTYDLCVALLLHPLLSLTHWIFRSLMLPYKSSSHSANHVRCARQRRVLEPLLLDEIPL